MEVNNKHYPKIQRENFNGESEKILNVPQVELHPDLSRAKDDSIIDVRLLKPISLALEQLDISNIFTGIDISCMVKSATDVPHIPYEELQMSTNNWDNNLILGRGGFGKVYKGSWKFTDVAIKRLEQKGGHGNGEIKLAIIELHCLNSYRHENVLPLYGYCILGPHACLIYQYMAGGSLEHRLKVRDPASLLKWPTRLNIAIGVARGLQFLHTSTMKGKPLIHGDIKSANILLDSKDQPKIGDFGLAREGPPREHPYVRVSRVRGTRPYLPDEFLRAKMLSTKVDIYSFGVLLFEIATSLAVYTNKRKERLLTDHVMNYMGNILNLKDSRVKDNDGTFIGLMEIGKQCVRRKPKERPVMVSVLIMLEGVPSK